MMAQDRVGRPLKQTVNIKGSSIYLIYAINLGTDMRQYGRLGAICGLIYFKACIYAETSSICCSDNLNAMSFIMFPSLLRAPDL